SIQEVLVPALSDGTMATEFERILRKQHRALFKDKKYRGFYVKPGEPEKTEVPHPEAVVHPGKFVFEVEDSTQAPRWLVLEFSALSHLENLKFPLTVNISGIP